VLLEVWATSGCTLRDGCGRRKHSQECLCHKIKRSDDLAVGGGAARPGPVLGTSGEACLDGIVLDVGADGVELFGRADPMVEGLVLPEMFLFQGED